jgi:hypothetical protein
MAQAKLPFDAMDDFIKWKKFKEIPDSSIIYAEDFWLNQSPQVQLFNQGFNWEGHIYNKTKKLLRTARNKEIFYQFKKENNLAPTYFLKKIESHKTKEAIILFAPIENSSSDSLKAVSDSVTLFYHSTFKEFCISFKLNGNPLTKKQLLISSYKDSIQDNHYTINISGNNKQSPATVVTIHGPSIDLTSFVISNIQQPERPTIEVFEQ